MKILILGGHGFIGCHTSAILKKLNHTVCAVDCYHTYHTYTEKEYHSVLPQRILHANADYSYNVKIEDEHGLSNVFEMFKPDVVIHLATYPNAKMVQRNLIDAANNMLSATANILVQCKTYQVKRLVFASSSMVYGDFLMDAPDENHVCNPQTLYGSFKLQGEHMVKLWARDTGMEYVILRPSALYGTRDMIIRIISQMTINCLKNKTIIAQGPDNKLDFSYVEDVAEYFARAATLPNAANQIFNSTRGRGRKIIEAAELVRSSLGFGEIVIKPHDDFYPNRDTLNSDKIKSILDFDPNWDIELGIPTYINWLLAQDYI